MPRSAKTISNDGSLGQETMLSGLFTSPVIGPKILMKVRKVDDVGEGNVPEIPVVDAVVAQVLHSEHRLGI